MPTKYRPIEPDDLKNIAQVFITSLNHRNVEAGLEPIVDFDDATAWDRMWEEERRPLFEHISAHEGCGWLAEDEEGIVGYGRSIQRDHVRQLTELFVRPDKQNVGLGKELLARAFQQIESPARIILANNNPAALSRYMRAGVHPVCTIFEFERLARPVCVKTDLEASPILPDLGVAPALNEIDNALLGYTRSREHLWLAQQRKGFAYSRGGAIVGYAYAGRWCGPIAALNDADLPAILAHIETVAAETTETFGLMVALPNRVAIMYALEQGFKLDSRHTTYFLADFTPPGLDRYVFSLPGFFT